MEPEIAPLAKRLAEENNVNWRALTGSGANGRILERDVLEYLARVMAGEEDVNPTSEPLPEGMDAWPEEDVKSYYGVDTSAETPAFDSDIDDTSLFVEAAEPAPVDSSLSEDIFLVDEEDLSVSAASHEPIVYDASTDSLDDDISDVYDALTLDDTVTKEIFDDTSELIEVESSHEASAIEPALEFEADTSAVDALAVEQEHSVVPAFADPSQNTDGFADTAALFTDDVAPVEEAFSVLAEPNSFEMSLEDVSALDTTPAFEAASDTSDTDVFEAPSSEGAIAFADAIGEARGFEEAHAVQETVAEVVEPEIISTSYDAVAEVASDDIFVAEVISDPIEDSATQENAVVKAVPSWEPEKVESFAVESIADSEQVTETFEPEPVYVPEVAESIAPVATLAASAALGIQSGVSASQLPLVSYGVLLRRHIDLSTLIQAQHAVAEELGQEDPAVITGFLVRAAAKALHKVPLVQGSVGLASIREQGVGMMAIRDASEISFRNLLNITHQALGGDLRQDSVALAVADMSGFDIDEAVLNVGAPVLTLGRMMYDNAKGTHQSTLAISGNVSVESGTKFLSAVAEFLNSPVRLVV